jgi:quercetin dioxygenase-like cupin family protein
MSSFKPRVRTCIAAALLFAASNAGLQAQPPGLTTKLLLKTTYSQDLSKDALIVSAELAPMATTGRHTHAGDEYGTVLEGELEVRVEGKEPRRIKAGEAYHNAKGVVHEARNPTQSTTRLLSTFIVEKGQPIIQPAN